MVNKMKEGPLANSRRSLYATMSCEKVSRRSAESSMTVENAVQISLSSNLIFLIFLNTLGSGKGIEH